MTNDEFRIANSEKKEGRTPALMFAGVLLLLDQVTKYFFSSSDSAYCNPVGPWGISVSNEMLIIGTIAVLLGAGYLFFAETIFLRDSSASLGMTTRGSMSYHMAFALLFAGGFSNLLDRILFGCVHDFSFVSWFPAFNLADVYLTIGAILGVSILLLWEKKSTPLTK